MEQIKSLRNKKGVSQSKLAEYLGVSLRTIQNYETGKVTVPTAKLNKIAKYFCVNVADLFENNENPEIEKRVFTYKGEVIPDVEIVKYLMEDDSIFEENYTLKLWLKTKIQEGVIKVLGKDL